MRKVEVPEHLADHLTIAEFAEAVNLTPSAVDGRLRGGKIPFVRYLRFRFIHHDEVARELRAQKDGTVQKGRYLTRVENSAATPKRVMTIERTPEASVKEQARASARSDTCYTGEQAAQAIDILDEGGTAADLVRRMKITFPVAKSIIEDSQASGAAIVLGREDIKALRTILGWQEDRPTLDGLRAVMVKALGRKVAQEKAALKIVHEPMSPDEVEAMRKLDEQDAIELAEKDAEDVSR